MRIAILGAGAMGCLYGGSLAKIGHHVQFIDVSEHQINAINTSGLRLIKDGAEHVIRVRACKASEAEGPFDLIMLFTKTIYSESALTSVQHLILPETYVLSIQNGLGNKEKIAQYTPESHIIIGMTGYPCDLKAPGIVESNGSSFTAIMNADCVLTERVKEIADEITKAGLNCSTPLDIYSYIWEKVCFNAAMNAITSITRLPVGLVAECGGRELVFATVHEAVDTAKANGVEVDSEKIDDMVKHAFIDHYHHAPSMLQDVLAGRLTEAASLNGAISDAAEAVGASAPINKTLFSLLNIIQNSYKERL